MSEHASNPNELAENIRSSIRHFSLMNSLLSVLNASEHNTNNSVLARYFLEHFDQLDQLNVYDVADACFTSRSGIRRFCQSIGLDNFSDLKSYTWEWTCHRNLYVDYTNHPSYRMHLAGGITEMFEHIDALASDAFLDDLAHFLHGAEDVVILTSDFSSMSVWQFQQSMLYLHKIVHVVTDSAGDISQIGTLDSKDALVVISEHGNYAKAVQEALSTSPVPRALITVDGSPELRAAFDYVIRLAGEQELHGRTVYANYGIMYFLDLLYNRYFTLFDRDE